MDIIAFQGLYPHSGATSVACAYAWAVADSDDVPGRAVLVDMAAQTGIIPAASVSVASMLDIPSEIPPWHTDRDTVFKALMGATLYDQRLYVLPLPGGCAGQDVAPDALAKLFEQLSELDLATAVIDAGIRGSAASVFLADKALMTITLAQPDTATFDILQNTTLLDNEYLLFNRIDHRSHISGKIIETLRNGKETGPRILDAGIPVDEFVLEAAQNRQPYTRYMKNSESSSQTRRLILDYLLKRDSKEDTGGSDNTENDSDSKNDIYGDSAP